MPSPFGLSPVIAFALALCVTIGTFPQLFGGNRAARAGQASGSSARPAQSSVEPRAIACTSVTACVVVGWEGRILTTADGGRHWARRVSGTTRNLLSVACPGPTVCYAVGGVFSSPPPRWQNVILVSVDGGLSWRHPPSRPPFGPALAAVNLTCPDVRTCLISNLNFAGPSAILRTRNGGKTWTTIDAPVGHYLGDVTCPTSTVCYGINGHTGQAMRSTNGGTTWEDRATIPAASSEIIEAIFCSGANTCVATSSYCCSEGTHGGISFSQDGAHTWTLLHHWETLAAYHVVCLDLRLCYLSTTGGILRTRDGGRTWSFHDVPAAAESLTISCPSRETCYTTTGSVVLKTRDGFDHTQKVNLS